MATSAGGAPGAGVGQEEIGIIRTLFMEAAEETRHEPTGWECTLLEVLREDAQVHNDRFEMTVSEILTAMNIEGDKQPGHRWVGETITRGGNRPGSGRPKRVKTFSDEVKKDFLKAAKEKAKETGRTLGQVVVGLIYDENIQDSVRIAALKAWAEVVVVKESKQTVEGHRIIGPTIGLPPVMKRPDRDEEEEKRLKGEMH